MGLGGCITISGNLLKMPDNFCNRFNFSFNFSFNDLCQKISYNYLHHAATQKEFVHDFHVIFTRVQATYYLHTYFIQSVRRKWFLKRPGLI